MHKQKRKALEADGWKVGTAQEFLDLSDEEAALIDLKLALGRALKERWCHCCVNRGGPREVVAVFGSPA